MSRALFAYGTLMWPELVAALLGRNLPARPARLEGYVRYRVRDKLYPGIASQPGAATEGVLIEGLEAADVGRLDAFEGPLYERRPVEVVAAGGARVRAETYVIPESQREILTDEPWSREHFERQHLPTWVRLCTNRRSADEIGVG